jgi:hypothetical protein
MQSVPFDQLTDLLELALGLALVLALGLALAWVPATRHFKIIHLPQLRCIPPTFKTMHTYSLELAQELAQG